jgi:hypothetical protein
MASILKWKDAKFSSRLSARTSAGTGDIVDISLWVTFRTFEPDSSNGWWLLIVDLAERGCLLLA